MLEGGIQTVLPLGKCVGLMGPERKILNLLGFFCPIPINETRIALSELSDGDLIEVVRDDRETLRDIPLLCKRLNVSLISIEENSGEFTFLIKNSAILGDI